jgi:hypothetical protein
MLSYGPLPKESMELSTLILYALAMVARVSFTEERRHKLMFA